MIPGGLNALMMGGDQGGIPQDFIAHYTMDNVSGTTLYDEAGNYDATLVGSPSFVAGYNGDAIDLDGIDDYIDTGITSLAPTDLTIVTRFNLDAIPTTAGDYKSLFSSRNVTGAATGIFCYVTPAASSSTGNTCFRPHINTSTGLKYFDTAFIPTSGSYIDLIFEYSSTTGVLKMVINGTEDANTAVGGGVITGTANSLLIGDCRYTDGGANYIRDGKNDDAYIYTRLLTADEKTAHHNS